MMKHYLHFGVMAMSVITSSFVARSQEMAVTTDSTVINLRDVEVTANRAVATTPIAFTNFTAAEIAAGNDGRDLPFIIQSTPSIVVTGDAGGGIGYSSIRVRGTDPSRINITANGVPINDSESHNVYWVNMPDLASSLRDVQIQRGAGTSTNGAGAFGASINMITDAPSFVPSARVIGSYGSYNSNRETIKVATGLLADHWSMEARISHIGSDGYIDRAWSKLWSYMGQVAYTGGNSVVRLLVFGGREKTYMAWDYASLEEIEKYGRRYNPCGEYTAADGSTAYYPDQYDLFTQHHFQLHGAHQFNDKWRLNVALHYTKGDGYYNQYKTRRTLVEYGLEPFMDAEGNLVTKSDLVRLKHNDNDFGGGMFNLNYTSGRVNGVLGGATNWHRGNHFGQIGWVRNYVGPIDPLQEYYFNVGRKWDSNIFMRADVDITRGFSAYADIQYRHIRYSIRGASDNYDWATEAPAVLDVFRNYNFFNPKVGATYLKGGHRAYVSWSVTHKEPVRDNFTDGDPNHYPEAERLYDYEAGYTYETKLFNIGANLYYMDYKDQLVVTGQLSDTGNPLSVNVPSSYRMGIELQGELHPVDWFGWSFNATLSRNRIKNFTEYIYEDEWTNPISFDRGNTPIAFSPDCIFNNSFMFSVADFKASIDTRFVSSQYMNNAASADARLGSYTVTDLHLGYTFHNLLSIKSLSLALAVYNVLNRKYFNNGYAGAGYYIGDHGEPVIYRYAGYAVQAPCHVLATVTLDF